MHRYMCVRVFDCACGSSCLPPVPLGASGDEKSPSFRVTGDATLDFQGLFESTSPCNLYDR